MKFTGRFVAAACAGLLLAPHAGAQDKAERPFVDKLWHAQYDVDKDGRTTRTVVARYQVLQEALLERSKVYSISFSTSIETGEVLEAYTLKADGRQIAVPLPVPLPGGLPAGEHRITLGVYDMASGQRLPIAGAPAADPALDGSNALLLETVEIQ